MGTASAGSWGRRRGAYPDELSGEQRGAGSLASGWGEALERRRPGGNSAGRAAPPQARSITPLLPSVRAASILVAWIGWEWQVSRSGRPRAPIRAGAGYRNWLRESAGSRSVTWPEIWLLHLPPPTPTQKPTAPPVPCGPSCLHQSAGQVWSVMGRSHSAVTCSPLGVGVVLGNCVCCWNSGFKWLG